MQKNTSGQKDNIIIHNLCFEDINGILKIEQESYPDPWSRKMFERELNLDFSHFFVATILSEIVAYVCFWHVADEAHVTNIAVSEKYRKKGVGSKMLKYIIDLAKSLQIKKMFLEVRANNIGAKVLYENYGFKNIGIRKKYYSNKDDAVIMEKIL
ncbi:MAG: ribosomal protein S18-alanine N-acetyltransferase [Elusimicrobia bacterium]|nr:ribosomal protein S18-alanine N-acetyltransferase [Elusimicrobiota bacterium]